LDTDCGATEWCNTATLTCSAKLTNGTVIPTVTGHSPALTGVCSTAVATAVCASGVCDPNDNACGLANGDGSCASNEVCRSGACDSKDQTCGYLAGDGPCTTNDVCRAASCDVQTALCGTAMCTKDADCPAGDYCAVGGVCTPKLPVGKACAGDNACKSDFCDRGVCTGFIASGNGFSCTVEGAASRSGEGVGCLSWLLVLALCMVRKRNQRSRSPEVLRSPEHSS
jgi:hypothetical protein